METQANRRSKGTGSIFQRNGKYVYQWRCITGKKKTKTLNALTLAEAQKEIDSIQQEEIKLSAIDSKITYMHQIAEAKALLHVCRIPLTELEDAFFSHPSAPSISPKHRAIDRGVEGLAAVFGISRNFFGVGCIEFEHDGILSI